VQCICADFLLYSFAKFRLFSKFYPGRSFCNDLIASNVGDVLQNMAFPTVRLCSSHREVSNETSVRHLLRDCLCGCVWVAVDTRGGLYKMQSNRRMPDHLVINGRSQTVALTMSAVVWSPCPLLFLSQPPTYDEYESSSPELRRFSS
jgi:hypothetical protein